MDHLLDEISVRCHNSCGANKHECQSWHNRVPVAQNACLQMGCGENFVQSSGIQEPWIRAPIEDAATRRMVQWLGLPTLTQRFSQPKMRMNTRQQIQGQSNPIRSLPGYQLNGMNQHQGLLHPRPPEMLRLLNCRISDCKSGLERGIYFSRWCYSWGEPARATQAQLNSQGKLSEVFVPSILRGQEQASIAHPLQPAYDMAF